MFTEPILKLKFNKLKLISNLAKTQEKVINQRYIFLGMASTALIVQIPEDILDTIYSGAKQLYPRESFLLLRGKKNKNVIKITDLVLAPFAVHGEGNVHFNPYMFSGDFSLVGTVHSHPSGNISPSHVDMNYFFGRILMIVGPPFEGITCIAAYDSNADELRIEITPSIGFDSEFDSE